MSKILCIETSTDVCSVCIAIEGKPHGLREFKEFKHSSHLLPLILESIEVAGIQKSGLDAISLSKGPGSYTGLRVGASTAKGLAYALDIPLISIDTLTALANGIVRGKNEIDENLVIISMIDARRDEVYAAIHDCHLNILKPTHPLILDSEFQKSLPADQQIIICGNGAKKANHYCNLNQNISIHPTECTAENLCTLSKDTFEKSQFENLDRFEPNYLKPPRITKPKSPLLKDAN